MAGESRPIGSLSKGQDGLIFCYEQPPDEPLSAALTPPSSLELSVDQTNSFFGALRPEGLSMERVLAQHKVDNSDLLGVLSLLGADCPGAIVIQPEEDEGPVWDADTEHICARLGDMEANEIVDRVGSGIPLHGYTRHLALLPGKRPMAGIGLARGMGYYVPRAGLNGCTTHILRGPKTGQDDELEVELLALRLAQSALGAGAVCSARMVRSENAQALLVSRDDRYEEGRLVHRLPRQTLSQALCLPPGQNLETKGPPGQRFSASAVGALLGMTQAPLACRRRFFEVTLFQLATGNTDGGGDNTALVRHRKGWQIAPLSNVGLPNDPNAPLPFRIGEADKFEFVDDWELLRFAQDLGFRGSGKSAQSALRRMSLNVLRAVRHCDTGSGTEGEKKFAQAARERALRLAFLLDMEKEIEDPPSTRTVLRAAG